MIKRGLYILLLAVMLLATGCRSKKIIPDDTLAEIFHDAFVLNAYIGEERINIDSLQIYEPLFNSYGYTTQDVVHTVGNFSRRKSARLGSVVEEAISSLEKESKVHAQKVVVLDTIRNVAVRTFTRTIYQDSLIRASKRADSTALNINISPIVKGHYTISFAYICEGDLEKYPRRAEFYFEDEDGYRHGYASVPLRQNGALNRTIIARESASRLILKLGDIDTKGKRYPSKQSLKISKLKVVHKLDDDDAVDSLFNKYVDIKIFPDGFPIKKDSLALSADSTRVSAATTRNR